MRMRASLRILLALSLIAPSAAPVPLALAQSGTAAPPADPPYPGGAIIESIPPDAIVLSLDETIKLALENNLSIIVQRFQPRSTATLVDIEKSVFDPLVTGTASIDDLQGDGELRDDLTSFSSPLENTDEGSSYSASWLDPLTTGGSYQILVGSDDADTSEGSFDQYLLTNTTTANDASTTYWRVTYTQPLLRNFGRDVNLWPVVVAQKALGISESTFRQTVIDQVAAAEKAYWDLNFAILQLRTSRFSLKLAQDFLEQNRIKVRVGTLAPIEITQAEAGVADREEFVIIYESALRAAEDNVRRLIGVRSDSTDWNRPVRPSDPLRLEEVVPNEDEAMQAALANRPDIEQARLQIEAREAEARARKSLRRWGLDFKGTYGNADSDSDFLFEQGGVPIASTTMDGYETTNWTAGLTLSIPIHNRLAIANATRAENELAQSQYQLDQAAQLARVEISSAVRAVNTTIRRVQSSQVNVRLQREKLQAEQKKFENGMSTSFQVLQYQDDLANAETRENLARADYNKALVELGRVKGTILAELGILLAPAAGGEQNARAQSAALRTLWAKPADAWADPGLRPAARVTEGVRLPADFSYAAVDGARFAATTDWIGAAGGEQSGGPAGGR